MLQAICFVGVGQAAAFNVNRARWVLEFFTQRLPYTEIDPSLGRLSHNHYLGKVAFEIFRTIKKLSN